MKVPNAFTPPQPPLNKAVSGSAVPMPADEGREVVKDLMAQIETTADAAEKWGHVWGLARWVVMSILIGLAVIVAGEKQITSFAQNLPNFIIPTCALILAAGTGFDQIIKPGTRWLLCISYGTKFRSLKVKAHMIDPTDREAISKLTDEFQTLKEKYFNDTIP
jgi:hypothetical protein